MKRFSNNMKELKERPIEMSVKYRFKSSIEFSTVIFLGSYISVGDLRKEITKQKRLAPNADYELQIMNAETKHVYEFDPTLIPANTNLIVSRIPAVSKSKLSNQKENELENTHIPTSPELLSLPATSNQFSKTIENTYYQQNNYENCNNDYNNYYGGEYGGNEGYYNYGTYGEQSAGHNYYDYEYGYSENSAANTDTTAEPNPNLQYIPMTPTPTSTNKSHRYVPYNHSYSRRTSKEDIPAGQTVGVSSENSVSTLNEAETALRTSPTGGRVPANYKCFKCGHSGHWIKHCPLFAGETQAVKKSTGIPRSQMVIVNDAVEGAYLTPEGRYAVPVTHMNMEAKRAQKQ